MEISPALMFRPVTEAQLNQERAEGERLAAALNRLFETHRATDLYAAGTLQLAPNPHVAAGGMGDAYKGGTLEWAQHGAGQELLERLDAPDKPKFGAGFLGSVWLDISLTGGRGGAKRTKRTRVYPAPKLEGDSTWVLILDATFEERW